MVDKIIIKNIIKNINNIKIIILYYIKWNGFIFMYRVII